TVRSRHADPDREDQELSRGFAGRRVLVALDSVPATIPAGECRHLGAGSGGDPDDRFPGGCRGTHSTICDGAIRITLPPAAAGENPFRAGDLNLVVSVSRETCVDLVR